MGSVSKELMGSACFVDVRHLGLRESVIDRVIIGWTALGANGRDDAGG